MLPSFAANFRPAEIEFFESKIRPVLAQECYECHNSKGKSKAGLILDHREGILRGGDTGPALVPGKAAESLIIDALKHENDLTMPKAGVKLDPPVIADFERWINMGAPDPRDDPPSAAELEADTNWDAIFQTRKNWWSLQPIELPDIPAGEGDPIDRFVRARLAEEKLDPAKPAPARVLARRLHYALTGLPPAPESLDEFEREASVNRETAAEDLIDSLLASPQFGERWARHWMDWVRYAESHGSEGDPAIPNAYQYRDYLIRALNDDIPYDQLVTEHIAGDLLEKPRYHGAKGFNESLLGAIQWRMVFHGFAPTDALDEKVRFTDDQINTFTKAFLGLTVSCARCHNHKFDAISQADYYALFGILGSTRPGVRLIDHPDLLEKNKVALAALKPEIRRAVAGKWLAAAGDIGDRILAHRDAFADAKKMDDFYYLFSELSKNRSVEKPIEQLKSQWSTEMPPPIREWDLTDPKVYQTWFKYGNGLPAEPLPAGAFQIGADGSGAVLDAILPSGVYSNNLSSKHAARLASPEFDLEGDSFLYIEAIGGGDSRTRYVVQNYPRSGTVFKVNQMPDRDKSNHKLPWQWHNYDLTCWRGDAIHIELSTAKDSAVLVSNHDRSWFGIRRAMLCDKLAPKPDLASRAEHLKPVVEAMGSSIPESPDALAEIFQAAFQAAIEAWADGSISDAQAILLDEGLRNELLPNSLDSLGDEVKELVTRYRKLEDEIVAPTRVPGIDEWTARNQPVFERGDHKKPLEPVSRRFLDAVDDTPYQTAQSGRLELAADLLRPDNPLTRRVIVNRVWTHLFGNGIVGSVDNFGRLGEKPTHPRLLDYLAASFDRQHNWSIKSLIKEIVSSQTWQRESLASVDTTAKDPENRLLSHFPILRLEGEAIRDKMIFLSGNLEPAMYGPGADGEGNRRSVYVKVIRNNLDPFLGVFEAPIPFAPTGKRPETNVPAQSLAMLNDRQVVKMAGLFAGRFPEGTDRERIAKMWTAALDRIPLDAEVEASVEFLEKLRSRNGELAAESKQLKYAISNLTAANFALTAPVRKRLEEESASGESFEPIASWDFARGTRDSVSGREGSLTGNARIENGGLVFDGKSSFFSAPLRHDLTAKTLEAAVTLAHLNQKGGGVLTVQDLRGNAFDSIVFAERQRNEWMAGSSNFRRTRDFGGPADNEADARPVHVAIAYDSDGTIRGYVDGKPYGAPYQSNGPETYRKGDSQVVIGLRHGTANGGNRNLEGIVYEARVYDRALDADAIAALAAGKRILTKAKILDSLSDGGRREFLENEAKAAALSRRLSELEEESSGVGEKVVWQSFAHSLFNLKEFIYVY